jgi:hypothetical protein
MVRRAAFPAFRIQGADTLVPEGVDACRAAASFVSLTMSSLILLGLQPAVKDCMQREPGLLRQVQALSRAVSAAGVRVRDAGLLKDMFDSNLAVYTPEEIWTFDLAFDVIALLGALDGLTGEVHANMVTNLHSLDRYAHNDAWRNAMQKAGEGPVAWHEFRARIPRRG